MSASELAQQLEQIISGVSAQLEEISDQTWSAKPHPDKWSKKEVLGHLCDSAINNIHRFVRAQHGDMTNIFYNQDKWVQLSNYQERTHSEVINLWQYTNRHIALTWKNIDDNDLSKTIPVKDDRPTLVFLMTDYIDHLNHHIKQIID